MSRTRKYKYRNNNRITPEKKHKNKTMAEDLVEGFFESIFRTAQLGGSSISIRENLKSRRRYFLVGIIMVALIFAILILLATQFKGVWIGVGIIALIISVAFFIGFLRRIGQRKYTLEEVERYIHRALETMDNLGRWYFDEDAATRELVASLESQLKSQKIDVIYHPKIGSGRVADAKVGNILIEAKLSPTTTEVDRLLGQLSEYTKYGNKVNVVIYGRLDKKARERIENEISLRYIGQVGRTYLSNPRRLRSLNTIDKQIV